MKSIWKGSLSFGLVSIPVQLFTARESQALSFHVFHAKCLTRLEYHHWCPKCKKNIAWDAIVKGIKKPNGSYLFLTPEVIKELRPKKTEEIKIVEFVDVNQIPFIYFERHYYVAPYKKESSAFALFIKALATLNKVAIGRFVMRDKEYTCAIQAYDNYLVLTTLYYTYEIRGLENLAYNKKAKTNPTELKLAQEIVQKLSVKKFDITEFKDTFAQEIKKMLSKKTSKAKAVTKKVAPKRTVKKPSLVESLRESVRTAHRQPVAHAKKR